ncbi:MAG: VCBS repeat-containing protein, partial [Polyangiaceae bacterium]|nr:VCBS repeat-containing protein [Polyangiaceae bacterium]
CSDGQCLCDGLPCCQEPLLMCKTDDGVAVCIDPQSSDQHCGGCGHACGPDENCVAGACQGCSLTYFHLPVAYEAGPQMWNTNEKPLVEDLDADGRVDVAVASTDDSHILVYPGLGNGELGEPEVVESLPQPCTPVFATLYAESDGSRDLLLGGWGGLMVRPAFESGYRGYYELQSFDPDWEWRRTKRVWVDDLVGDEQPDVLLLTGSIDDDLVSVIPTRLWLSENRGLGSGLEPTLIHSTNSIINDLRVEDLNGDGVLDIALLSSSVHVLWGNGDGTWTYQAAWLPTGSNIHALHLSDVNNDGRTDLLAAHAYGIGTLLAGYYLRTFLATADSGFELLAVPDGPFTANLDPLTELVDLDGDGVVDFLSREQSTSRLSSYLGNGDGTFTLLGISAVPASDAPGSGSPFAAGDLNDDGQPDVVAVHGDAEAFTTHLGRPDGTFDSYMAGLPDRTLLRGARAYRYADHDDPVVAVVGGLDEGTFRVLRYDDGSSAFELEQEVGIYRPQALILNDADGDGHPDALIQTQNNLSWIRYQADGRFAEAPQTLVSQRLSYPVGTGDLDGDGQRDLVVRTSLTGSSPSTDWRILSFSADGTWTEASSSSDTCSTAALGDVTGDGLDDIIAVVGSRLEVWPGKPEGMPEPEASIAVTGALRVFTADLDGQGPAEILVGGRSGYRALQVSEDLQISEMGAASRPMLTSSSSGTAFVADVNGDGLDDVFEPYADGRLYLWTADGSGGFEQSEVYLALGGREAVALEDLDGDGLNDLLLIGASSYDGSLLPLKGAVRCE